MKIAIIAPLEESIPPQFYGGIEWIVYHIAHGLGKKGHEIDLYATGDSKKSKTYNVIPITEKSLRSIPKYANNVRLRESAKWAGTARIIKQIQNKKYDIIHNHASWRMLAFADLISPQMVTTHHSPLSIDYQVDILKRFTKYPHISISHNQQKDLPDLRYIANIYNGTDTEAFVYSENTGDPSSYVTFLARMSPEKGAIDAVIATQNAHKSLHIAAKVDQVDKKYYDELKPFIDGKSVSFVGEITAEDKLRHIQNARCLIAPIQWEEPFGLMFTEAMACGTPVIAYSRGAAPEIIQDGINGYLVNQSDEYIRGNYVVKKTGIAGLTEAIERVYALSESDYKGMRQNARRHIEINFSVSNMVEQYEKVFNDLLSQSK